MESKEKILKTLTMQSHFNQLRRIIKFILYKEDNALTAKELHLKLRNFGYTKTFDTTRKTLWRMERENEVMVSLNLREKHYFVI